MPSKTVLDISPVQLREYAPFRRKKGAAAPALPVDEARSIAREIAEVLKHRFGAKRVVMFGSLARGDFAQGSDIDLAAWGIAAPDYYRAVAFASGFSKIWKVDLVDAEDCSGALLAGILSEGVEL